MSVQENKTLNEQIIKKTKDISEFSSINAIPNIVRSKSKALRLIIIVFSKSQTFKIFSKFMIQISMINQIKMARI